MKNKICNRLLKVDSIVTILLTVVVCVLALKGQFDIKETFLMIIAFYFTKKAYKEEGDQQ